MEICSKDTIRDSIIYWYGFTASRTGLFYITHTSKNVFAFYAIMPLWYMVYLISCIYAHMTYDMTPLRGLYAVCRMSYVTCITIIDTIIHHILTKYTNNAYIFDTYDKGGVHIGRAGVEIIGEGPLEVIHI
jgi:hypothetical protein